MHRPAIPASGTHDVKRLPLSDQLPYEFIPPRFNRFWCWVGGFYNTYRMRREQRIAEIDFQNIDRLLGLIRQGDSILITPNHADHADVYVLYELSRRLKQPFFYMAAFQIFRGLARWVLPRLGVFSIDREGTDLSAFKTAVNTLVDGKYPLVIFPEGENLSRCRAASHRFARARFAIAAAAARKIAESGRKLWVVPVGLGYRFLDGYDPLPELQAP